MELTSYANICFMTMADMAVKRVVADAATNTDGIPMRELLGLDKALQRSRGGLDDNIARLSQLNGDIAQAE